MLYPKCQFVYRLFDFVFEFNCVIALVSSNKTWLYYKENEAYILKQASCKYK